MRRLAGAWLLLLSSLAPGLGAPLLLINENARNLAQNLNDRSPFGVLGAFRRGEWVETCNAFHVSLEGSPSRLATAAHCLASARERGAEELRLYFFDNRTGKQADAGIDFEDVHFDGQSSADEKATHAPDFVLIDLSPTVSRRWDWISFVPKTAPSDTKPETFEVLSYEVRAAGDPAYPADVLKDKWRAVFQKVKCKGIAHHSPQFTVEWLRPTGREVGFGKNYTAKLSPKGLERDREHTLFLENCELRKGFSGSMVLDARGRLVGLLHTGITSDTFRKMWEGGLHLSFVKEAIARLGKDTELKKGEYRYTLSSAVGENAKQFNPEKEIPLYGAALLFEDWLSTK